MCVLFTLMSAAEFISSDDRGAELGLLLFGRGWWISDAHARTPTLSLLPSAGVV